MRAYRDPLQTFTIPHCMGNGTLVKLKVKTFQRWSWNCFCGRFFKRIQGLSCPCHKIILENCEQGFSVLLHHEYKDCFVPLRMTHAVHHQWDGARHIFPLGWCYFNYSRNYSRWSIFAWSGNRSRRCSTLENCLLNNELIWASHLPLSRFTRFGSDRLELCN